jgi:hypothetical protein
MKQSIVALPLFLSLCFSVAFAQTTQLIVGYSSTASAELPAFVGSDSACDSSSLRG